MVLDDTIELKFKSSQQNTDMYLFSGTGTVNTGLRIQFKADNTMTWGSGVGDVFIDATQISSNSTSMIPYLDGVEHTISTRATSLRDVNIFGHRDGGTFFIGVIKDILFTFNAGGTQSYAIDSGSNATEDSIEGGLPITFVNVDSGDWS